MQVPLLDLKAQYQSIKKEILENTEKIFDSQYFIGGPYVKECEEKLAEYSKTKYAVGCSSGSDALILSLLSSDIKPGDEVITSPFTFFATVGAISVLGAVPKFVDVREDTFNIDPSKIEEAITDKTKAVIGVDLYGQTADLDEISSICKKHNLVFIEDSAQSIGAEYKGKRVGQVADYTTISFYPAKNLGAFGDAGAVLTNDEDKKAKLGMCQQL